MRRPGISHCALLAALAAAGLASTLARADTPAIDATTVGTYPPLSPNGFNYFQSPGNYTFTWDFTAKSAIDVTQLGYYNSALAGTPEPNGFGSHFLTLTDLTTDATLASATVTAGSTATGFFNYASIDIYTWRLERAAHPRCALMAIAMGKSDHPRPQRVI